MFYGVIYEWYTGMPTYLGLLYLWLFSLTNSAGNKNRDVMFAISSKNVVGRCKKPDIIYVEVRLFLCFSLPTLLKAFSEFEMPSWKGICS